MTPAESVALEALARRAPGGAPAAYKRFETRLDRVADSMAVLRNAMEHPGAGGRSGIAEWLLDNAYLIRDAQVQVRSDLPPRFYRELPVSAEGHGEPRVSRIARAAVESGEGFVDLGVVEARLEALQDVSELESGEIWALPTFLRLAVLEDLVAAGEGAIEPERIATSADESRIQDRVAAGVNSLRTFATHDWEQFFESVSRVEDILRRRDPAGVYGEMDFQTRDRYRKVVERVGRRSGHDESEVARAAVELALRQDPRRHVGFALEDVAGLEAALGARAPWGVRARRWIDRRKPVFYFLGVALGTVLITWGILAPLQGDAPLWLRIAALLVAVVPAHSVAVALANWIATRAVAPRPLPKLSPDHALSADTRTVVAIPALLSAAADIPHLARRMELNYEGNDHPHIRFALLTDHADAPRSTMPEDRELLDAAVASLEELNRRRVRRGLPGPFFLLHRRRRWNEREGVWMGWERKRGKLEELNRFLEGGADTTLDCLVGEPEDLIGSRFVVTLDADTVLPQGAAARLVGTLAHPLNRPVFDERGRVTRGYTVLQPRIETLPEMGLPTRFSRVFEADRGLDLYSHAVSDVYQDVFGEGSFAGKGIYDVAAFRRSLDGCVPDNAILSHDLFEGLHGRAGLVSDVAVFEDYPPDFITYARRLHRWVRGDWQLVPWLFPRVRLNGRRVRNRIDGLGRWKIFDNLRRSLLLPSILVMLVLGWIGDPARAWWWTFVAVTVPAMPVLLGAAAAVRRRAAASGQSAPFGSSPGSVPLAISRWVMALTFLPHQTRVELDAALRTLVRVYGTRRRLLEWTTASTTAQSLRGQGRGFYWLEMAAGPAAGVVIGAAILVVAPAAVAWAWPLLAAWIIAPEVAYRISHPASPEVRPLTDAQRRRVRTLARRTWAFYERFLSPEDHWLPPDNYQEEPLGVVAHRTSPTNIGMLLTSSLGAHDLGYLPFTHLTALLGNTFRTMEELQRHRGHLLNWYDTRTLRPLPPLYVSTVDSGNLLGCLLALSSGLRELAETPVRGRSAQGLEDTFRVLTEVVEAIDADGASALAPAREGVLELARTVGEATSLADLHRYVGVAARRLTDIADRAATLAESATSAVEPHRITDLVFWLRLARQQLERTGQELDRVTPWLGLPPPPTLLGRYGGPASQRAFATLERFLSADPAWRDVPAMVAELGPVLADLDRELEDAGLDGEAAERRWVVELADRSYAGGRLARDSLDEAERLAARADRMVEETDFTFLYNGDRRLFHIGFNLSTGELDSSYYDLLASEARLASFLAVALGQIPAHHWLHLGRPFHRTTGGAVLMSWAGTMFEYLMPSLLMRTPERSLLGESCTTSIAQQIRYGAEHRAPWGISESAFYQTDAQGIYQYRAFGVPQLGLRTAVRDRLVVAPYASVMALPFEPQEVLENLDRLQGLGMLGSLGWYEALDFGPATKGSRGPPRIVRTWMAHHQGMILLALVNAELDDVMVRRFHRPAATAAADFLLYEHVPSRIRLEKREARAPVEAPSTAVSRTVGSWEANPSSVPPAVQVLSNGTLSSLVGADGSGGLRWGAMAITRWRADPIPGRWGSWIYVHDEDSDRSWSAAAQPVPSARAEVAARFLPHQVELRRVQDEIAMRLTVSVAPTNDAEIRRLVVTNLSPRSRRLALTSYAEVVLGDPGQDRRHPAFSKLFVETAGLPDGATVLHTRRTDDPHQQVSVGHTVVLDGGAGRIVGGWSDRKEWLGRGGSTAAPRGLGRAPTPVPELGVGVTDPVQSLSVALDLEAGQEVELAFVTGVGSSKDAVMKTLTQLGSLARVGVALDQARGRSRLQLESLGIPPDDAQPVQALLSALLLPASRPRQQTPVMNGRDALWALGVSGDLPVLQVRVERHDETPPLLQLLRAHAYWSAQRVRVDLVVLDADVDGYAQPLRHWLAATLARMGRGEMMNQPGGVHHVPEGRLTPEARAALDAVSTVILDTGQGALSRQIASLRRAESGMPPFVPIPGPVASEDQPAHLAPLPPLQHDNGFGGFHDDGASYLVRVGKGRRPPAPWINVLANPGFGSIVSETGSGCTWVGNSSEGRLTTWTNDPVLDRPGEALYLRDEETGRIWSPTPGPAPSEDEYRAIHRHGETGFEHRTEGLDQEVSIAVPERGSYKVTRLTLTNLLERPRRITATYYAEWVLGNDRESHAGHLFTSIVPDRKLLTVRNQYVDFANASLTYLGSTAPIHSATCDRVEFLGSGGLEQPDGLTRIGLSQAQGAVRDPCGALQVHLDLPPGGTVQVAFILGSAPSVEAASEVLEGLRPEEAARQVAVDVREGWRRRLGRVEIRTPDPTLDVLVNGWLVYQALSGRLWGRTGLYQSSGAFGFRDQLQDSLAFLLLDPSRTRAQILTAAAHQFEEGDVLHWWHEGFRGVRTRCSDDLLWLPYVTGLYLEATGDTGILDEEVAFLAGEPLADGELERYATWRQGPSASSLYDHCVRAIRRGITSGPHGLPLIGTGDWNDSFDELGPEGRGESVWLVWFLHDVVRRFGPWCEARGDATLHAGMRAAVGRARQAAEDHAWDGDWYRRATHDEGHWIGARGNEEGEIDSLTQSWAVLSRGADPPRASRAMASVLERLVNDDDQLVALLTPPFRFAEPSPGYVRNYPPGVRENGGQYTHAGVWVAWALADLGWADEAWRVLRYLNPVEKTTTRSDAARYRREPYVVCGDVYTSPALAGIGGWSWYTGSAAWLYRLVVERIVGLRPTPGGLCVSPRPPGHWRQFEAVVRLPSADGQRQTRYDIRFERSDDPSAPPVRVHVDGTAQPDPVIPLIADGESHEVRVRLGPHSTEGAWHGTRLSGT